MIRFFLNIKRKISILIKPLYNFYIDFCLKYIILGYILSMCVILLFLISMILLVNTYSILIVISIFSVAGFIILLLLGILLSATYWFYIDSLDNRKAKKGYINE